MKILKFFNFFIIINFIIFINLSFYLSHPASFINNCKCNYGLIGIRYEYRYQTNLLLNNDENNYEPAGFQCMGTIILEKLWQNIESDDKLLKIELKNFQFKPRESLIKSSSLTNEYIDWPPLLIHINNNNDIENLFINNNNNGNQRIIESTHLNLVVSIMNALRTNYDNKKTLPFKLKKNDRNLLKYKTLSSPMSKSLLSPIIIDEWSINIKLDNNYDYSTMIKGWQNVTIRSKLYPAAHSKLYLNFELNLINEEKSTTLQSLSAAKTIKQAINNYIKQNNNNEKLISIGPSHYHAEYKPCQPYYCKTLKEFINDNKLLLSEQHSLATQSMSIGVLRFLNYIRINSNKLYRKDLLKLLQKLQKSRNNNDGNLFNTILDTIASSRHGESILAALDLLNLPKCHGNEQLVQDCERFLIVLTISSSTLSMMEHSFLAEHSLSLEQLLDLFLPLLNIETKWMDERIHHSFLMTISTLLHSYRLYIKSLPTNYSNDTIIDHLPYDSSHMMLRYYSSPTQFVDVSLDDNDNDKMKPVLKLQQYDRRYHEKKYQQLSEKIVKHLQYELENNCNHNDVECRIIILMSLGNTRIIEKYGMLNLYKKFIIDGNKRESIAAIRSLNNCLKYEFENNGLINNNDKLLKRLKQLLLQILYDSRLDTTTRLISSELLANYFDKNGDIINELLKNLDKFPIELATIIWKRSIKIFLLKNRQNFNKNNWHLHSNHLTGSSTSFKYIMGGTINANATYSVLLELLKGKLPKETSFMVDISNDNNNHQQEIINVGLFARGLQSFAGNGDDDLSNNINDINEEEEEESTMAGMTLHILGQQLRPLIFFRSTSELMGHVWSGTGSEPTTVFKANLLLSDYLDIKPLINGFLIEQKLMGVFSIDLSGEIQISIWNRNSHSNVQTKGSILFQGSQQLYASFQKTKTSAKKLFSFGSEAKLNFLTDFDFYTSPYRLCIQITQPEFIFKHNTRKYEQCYSDQLNRRIHRRSYKIPAKSYMLNRDNNEMCALMNGNDINNGIGGQEDNFSFNFD